jgi:outer membrane protein assembly factor BamE
VVALFDGDRLKSVAAPTDLPSEAEFVAAVVPPVKGGPTRPLELTEAQRNALPLPPKAAPAPVAAAAPPREYPPLERP